MVSIVQYTCVLLLLEVNKTTGEILIKLGNCICFIIFYDLLWSVSENKIQIAEQSNNFFNEYWARNMRITKII